MTEATHLAKPSGEKHQDDLLGPTPSRGLMQRHFSCLLTRGPGDRLDVTLSGEIDLTATDELTGILHVLAASRPAAIQVELHAVSFFSAAGVNFLAALRTLATEQHAALSVRGAPPFVHRLLDICGLGEQQETGPTATLANIDARAVPP